MIGENLDKEINSWLKNDQFLKDNLQNPQVFLFLIFQGFFKLII